LSSIIEEPQCFLLFGSDDLKVINKSMTLDSTVRHWKDVTFYIMKYKYRNKVEKVAYVEI
jgi:hypothetical protein